MTNHLHDELRALRTLMPALNSATDQATQDVLAVQRLLTDELKVGIAATQLFEETLETAHTGLGADARFDPIRCCRLLAYDRLQGTYQIHVLERHENVAIDEHGAPVYGKLYTEEIRTHWPSCGREVKLRAYQALPALLRQITKKARQLTVSATEISQYVRGAIAAAAPAAANNGQAARHPALDALRDEPPAA